MNEVAARRGEPWLDALRRQDLVRVVLPEGAADPARGPRGLRSGGAADRGVPTGSSGSSPASRRASACTAGYKAIWSKPRRVPAGRVLRRARPALRALRRREALAPHRPARRACRRLERPRSRTRLACARELPSRSRTSTPTWSVPAATVIERRRARDGHGYEHLPHPARRRAGDGRGHVRRRRGRRRPGLYGSRPGSLPSATSWPGSSSTAFRPRSRQPRPRVASASTRCSPRPRARSRPVRAGCSRWTGGTATARSWSTPNLSGLLVGHDPRDARRPRSTVR